VSITDRAMELFLGLHQFLYERSDGRVGHRMIAVPSLLLRIVGRRSGRTRTAALVYARDGADYVLVASNGGAERPPAWLYNIRANPVVEIQVGRRRMPARARIVASGDPDYQRLWRLADEGNHRRYSAYQRRTTRPIELVVVTPS
jgi:deazaflavin-dependent oxidoreductase (nitroreductase family)